MSHFAHAPLPLFMLLAALCPSCTGSGRAAAAATSIPTTAPASNPTGNSCRGHDLDVDRVAQACAHERPDESAPGRDALRIELEVPAAGVVSGNEAPAELRFHNISSTPLTLQLNGMCGQSFDIQIVKADGSRADIEEGVGGLGLCGTVPGIRVELEPGGVLTKRFAVSARAKRWVPVEPGRKDSPLELGPGAAIPPGNYTLNVGLPLYTDHRLGWKGQMHVTAALKIVAN